MPRFKATIRYRGTEFHGFQIQPDKPTIQDVLQKKLALVLGENISVIPSGRTDAGVHALAQVLHFDLNDARALDRVRDKTFIYKINSVLPMSIAVLCVEETTQEFHARQSAKSKTYAYWILQSLKHDPFFNDLAWHIPQTLNLSDMRAAVSDLLGRHDFSSFCAADSFAINKTRTITSILFDSKFPHAFFGVAAKDWLCIEFTGDGFLKQMVRNLVGTLVSVGRGKLKPEQVKEILLAKDRTKAHMTAPACGLFLKAVSYD